MAILVSSGMGTGCSEETELAKLNDPKNVFGLNRCCARGACDIAGERTDVEVVPSTAIVFVAGV